MSLAPSYIALNQCYNCGSKFVFSRRLFGGYDLGGYELAEGYDYFCKCDKCGAHAEGSSWAELENNWVLKRFIYPTKPFDEWESDEVLKARAEKRFPTLEEHLEAHKNTYKSVIEPKRVEKAREMSPDGQRILKMGEFERWRAQGECATQCGQQACAEHRAAGAPPLLLGGVNSKNIAKANKMDAGARNRSIGIDWIQGTIPLRFLNLFIEYVTEMVGHEPEHYNHGFSGYQVACEWHPLGLKVAWDLDDRNRAIHSNRILISLGGSGLGCFPPESLYQFCRDLSIKFFFKASRIDLSFDDFEKIIRPEEVNEYAEQGSYQGFRKSKYIGGSNLKGDKTDEGIYFGTRGKNGSGKFLRCYGKDIESKGEIDSVRWEVEFSKERANKVFFKLAMSVSLQDFATNIALFIGGSIDFIERNGKTCNPIDRLPFWEQILHYLGSCKLRCPKEEGSIEKTKKWIIKSVAPSLEKMRQCVGNAEYYEWINMLMQEVKISTRASGQIWAYHQVHGEPLEEEIPF